MRRQDGRGCCVARAGLVHSYRPAGVNAPRDSRISHKKQTGIRALSIVAPARWNPAFPELAETLKESQ